MTLEGILPVLKPVDFTSHDVVAKVRRFTGVKRIGHTGTLDPKVTGVLPLCIGRATRVVEYVQDLPKEYEAVLTIGLSTDTEDMTGQITERASQVHVTRDDIERAVRSFQGEIEQIPPMYSAVKVGGRRLYEMARQGIEVERKPRKVEIYRIEILQLLLDQPYPEISFRVSCSKGTYIRTLCADIGRALGYPAVMSRLVRTATGPFTLDHCLSLDEIAELAAGGRLQDRLMPADQALSHLPVLHLSERLSVFALQGRTVRLDDLDQLEAADETICRAYGPEDKFLGIFRLDPQALSLKPEKVFN
jgi:tRNA pseudouridine55 synthase